MERAPLLWPAVVAASIAFLHATVLAPLTLVVGLSFVAEAAAPEALSSVRRARLQSQGLTEEQATVLGEALERRKPPLASRGIEYAALCVIYLSLLFGGIGLLVRKPWGWWLTSAIYGFLVLYNLRLLSPLRHLDWNHPRAKDALTRLGSAHGVPIVLALTVLGLLLLPRMRLAYGVTERSLRR